MVGRDEGVRDGDLRQLKVTPLNLSWWARHDQFQMDRGFRDFQESGPLSRWSHQHSFLPAGEDASWLVDEIDFELPLAPFSHLLIPRLRRQFETMFRYRHLVTQQLRGLRQPGPGRYAVSGASGVLGRALVAFLSTAGHQVVRLVRRPPQTAEEVVWDPMSCAPMPQLEGLDGFVHLAGKGIMDGNYGPAHRAEIQSSRGEATAQLTRSLASLQRPPRVFVSASGIGYYGHRPSGLCTEAEPPGQDFLAQVCVNWEAASLPLVSVGTRRVCLRIAPVLTLSGGALPPLYWSCLAGPSWRLGDGQQPFSWISLQDTLGMVAAALADENWSGAYNCCAPEPATLGTCAAQVGAVLGGRPQFTVPERMVRLVLGARSSLLLHGCLGMPERAQQAGYRFVHPDLAGCLRQAVGCFQPRDAARDWSFEWFQGF